MSLSPNATLIGIPYSPWTLQARFALQHHGLAHRFEPYLPLVGEPMLRARLSLHERRLVGERLSVPILIERDRVTPDSRAIAERAEEASDQDRSRTLFPAEHLQAIDRWLDRLDLAKQAARLLVTERMLDDEGALVDAMPRRWPRVLKRASLPVGRRTCRFILAKYGGDLGERGGRLDPSDRDALGRLVLDVLVAASDKLERRSYLAGDRFSFADVSLVTTLEFVSPSPALGGGVRAFADARLEGALPTLLAARERIVREHPFEPAR